MSTARKINKAIKELCSHCFVSLEESYHSPNIGALTLLDLNDAVEAMRMPLFGPVKHKKLRWILGYEQMINLAVFSKDTFAGTYLGIPILMVSGFDNTQIFLVNIKNLKQHAKLSGITPGRVFVKESEAAFLKQYDGEIWYLDACRVSLEEHKTRVEEALKKRQADGLKVEDDS